MIPIFEQGSGQGIGYSARTFLRRFDEICSERTARDQASRFAFIFYDFGDQAIKRILKNQGVFAKLDRLAGTQLSIFYLHTNARAVANAFNSYFLMYLGVRETATLPCLVFFRVDKQKVVDVEIAHLDNADLIHGFAEIYGAVENYLNNKQAAPAEISTAVAWARGSSNVVRLDDFRAALERSL